jgi:hypothetical protein
LDIPANPMQTPASINNFVEQLFYYLLTLGAVLVITVKADNDILEM